MKNKKILSGVLAATVLFGANAVPISDTVGSGLVAFAASTENNITYTLETVKSAAAKTDVTGATVEFTSGTVVVSFDNTYNGTDGVVVTVEALVTATVTVAGGTETKNDVEVSGESAAITPDSENVKIALKTKDATPVDTELTVDVDVIDNTQQTPYVLQGDATVAVKKGETAITDITTTKGADGTLTVTVPRGTEGDLVVTVEQDAKKGDAAAVKATGTATIAVGASGTVALAIVNTVAGGTEIIEVGAVKVTVKEAADGTVTETPVAVSVTQDTDNLTAPATKNVALTDAAAGKKVKVTAVVQSGYEIGSVSYQKTEDPDNVAAVAVVSKDANGDYIFEMPEYAVTVTVTFKTATTEETKYAVTINPYTGVTATVDKTTAEAGDEIIITVSGTPEGKVVDQVMYQNADNNTVTFTTRAVDGQTNQFKFTMPKYAVRVLIVLKDAPAEGGDDNGNTGNDNTNTGNDNINTDNTTTTITSTPSTSSETSSTPEPEETKPAVVEAIPSSDKPVEVAVAEEIVSAIVGTTPEAVEKFKEATFTAEEIAAAGDKDVEIKVEVSAAPETVSTAKETINTAVGGEYEVGMFIEINLVAVLGDAKKNLTETGSKVAITLPVPADMQGKDVALAREHDGKVAILDDLDNDPATITVESDKFSTYAFVAKKAQSAASEPNASTGIALGVTPILLAGAAVTVAILKRKSK